MALIEQNKIFKVLKLIQKLYSYPPKSIAQLAEQLETSDKSIYRYLNLLEELGYEVQKNEHRKHFIKQSQGKTNSLDEEEKKLILSLLNSTVHAKNTAQAIKSKLQIDNTLPTAQDLAELRYLKMLDLINYAIPEKMPVKITGYQSTSGSDSPRERLVMPYHLDGNRMVLIAYDYNKKEIRHFKIQRMESLLLAEEHQNDFQEVNIPSVDLFGMSSANSYPIEMRLSKRAYLLLTEEFPSSKFKIGPNAESKTYPYIFKDHVCSYEGVGRFVLGLLNEIQICGNEGFKKHLREKITKTTLLEH